MKQNDQAFETSAGVDVTSPTPLTGKPASYIVGSEAPGQPEAPKIAIESPSVTRPERGGPIPEYKARPSGLPDSISAREIADDGASYTDGRNGNVGMGAR